MDNTEHIRRVEIQRINAEVQSDNAQSERQRLEQKYGKVWDTSELSKEFKVLGFMAPFVVIIRLSDNKKGSLEFQHYPRFYFNFVSD
jgi:hypothetical protein